MKVQRFSAVTGERDLKFPPGINSYVEDIRSAYDLDKFLTNVLKEINVTERVKFDDNELREYQLNCQAAIGRKKVDLTSDEAALAEVTGRDPAPDPAVLACAKEKVKQAKRELADSEAELKVHPTKLVVLHDVSIKITPTTMDTGTQYVLSRSDGKNITNHAVVVLATLEAIDTALQKWYYVIKDGRFRSLHPWSVDGVQSTDIIFNNMIRLNVMDGDEIGRANLEMATAMGLIREGGRREEMTDWRWVTYKDQLKEPWIWVPKQCVLSLCDADEDGETTSYTYDAAKKHYEITPSVPVGSFPCYRIGGTKASCTTAVCLPRLDGGQRSGGGGPMRADPVAEVEYAWNAPGGNEMGTLIAAAIGLSGESADVDALDGDYKRSPTIGASFGKPANAPGPLLEYAVKFREPCPRKRNLPRETFPLEPPAYTKSDRSFSLRTLRKKKKGEWSFNDGPARSGESLRHMQVGQRLNAGSIMGKAFKAAGLSFPGSATAFAKDALQKESALEADWEEVAEELTVRPSFHGVNVDARKKVVRTSQEWCHLFGHGDGGSETIENFISGSKHCNTEQLAIETAQRAGLRPDLSARITAYLVPADPKPKKSFTQTDRTFLKKLSPTAFPPLDVDKCVESGLKYLAKPETNIQAILRHQGGAESGVPDLATYQAAASDEIKKRYRDSISERLLQTILIPLPLGRVVRYKIYHLGAKIFDHFYWAQKESFDLNEFNILYWTVRTKIAKAFDQEEDLQTLLESKKVVASLLWQGL